ncbi:MAG: bifunctional demethylmenaquinone methyltransferase/2-methoxy-6-polyprenyl-1,4-benzoquinol methylase UbiE [Sediminibacterium sp.]|nr:bifunctional demethylmenaquinone methyltransferase/2-methoxy-6-polyprenyl-1,4-benzoquinol methylase UbiE [Sediminibacterium sp.]
MQHDAVTPYKTADSKKEQVETMFNNIAPRYDFLNSLLSLGIHKGWRKKCVKWLEPYHPQHILDVATGTADFAIECAKLNPTSITGVDISDGMMAVGREKIKRLNLENVIALKNGNAETLDFADNTFDAIVVGFGVRNFQNLEKGLENLRRILKPGGHLVVLEFSYPKNPFIRGFYNFYFSKVTPFIGRIFSNDTRAYTYLNESVKAFPHDDAFVTIMKKTGFQNATFSGLSFGIAAIYTGKK